MRDPKLLFWNNNLYCFELIVTSSLNRKMLFATQPWKAISTQINTRKREGYSLKWNLKQRASVFALTEKYCLRAPRYPKKPQWPWHSQHTRKFKCTFRSVIAKRYKGLFNGARKILEGGTMFRCVYMQNVVFVPSARIFLLSTRIFLADR